MTLRLALLAPLLLASPAAAATLALRIVDRAGQPVSDAVVTVAVDGHRPAGPIRFPWAPEMAQRDIAFQPGVLIVPVGATVTFPNQDRVRHHVYSFSKPARFELKLFGREDKRSYTFRTAGAVALGCNIHDSMSGFIKVVDTPFAAKSDGAGNVRLAGLPAGNASVTVWHPRLRARDNELNQRVTLPATGELARRLPIELR